MRNVALGIDLSLRATGLVAVPFDWGLDWSKVARATFGDKLKQTASQRQVAERHDFIARNLITFARKFGCTHAWIEQYAFSSLASRAHSLGELGGVLKRAVTIELGIPLANPVPPASARALLGKMPRKDAKVAAHLLLHNQCELPRNWTPDEIDAWIVTNYGLSGIKGADALLLRDAA